MSKLRQVSEGARVYPLDGTRWGGRSLWGWCHRAEVGAPDLRRIVCLSKSRTYLKLSTACVAKRAHALSCNEHGGTNYACEGRLRNHTSGELVTCLGWLCLGVYSSSILRANGAWMAEADVRQSARKRALKAQN